MTLGARGAALALRLRHPRTTVRWRLTLLYGGLFLACGAALLAITYTLVDHATFDGPNFQQLVGQRSTARAVIQGPPGFPKVAITRAVDSPVPAFLAQARSRVRKLLSTRTGQAEVAVVGIGQRIADLHQLEVESVIALAIMAVISGGLGWLVAGRVLRPLRTMTATTQKISEVNLHERLAMDGPRDELGKLADTIDGLLERLQDAFDAQRRFVANASHELRTPLTSARALLEMVISDPDATVQTYRETCEQVLEEGDQQEQLIDALLALARGQRGIDHPEALDLAVIAGGILQTRRADANALGLALEISLDSAPVYGDRRLIERLVSNLLDNAIRHNTPGGGVGLRVRSEAGHAMLTVANTGPAVPAGEVDRLLQPFQRLTVDRVSQRDGLGLGLSIVAAIATAHDAVLDVRPRDGGGLRVDVRFARRHAGNQVPVLDGTGRDLQPAAGSHPLPAPAARTAKLA